jgi:hypothetical protein
VQVAVNHQRTDAAMSAELTYEVDAHCVLGGEINRLRNGRVPNAVWSTVNACRHCRDLMLAVALVWLMLAPLAL